MKYKWQSLFVALAALSLVTPRYAVADGNAFQDPLDTAAVRQFGHRGVADQSMMAVAEAGGRIVAVGLRGLIILSDDDGKSWQQARVPVQTDLVAVQFVTPAQGWASGHDAVILHTEDGGATWTKQFDNRMAAVALPSYYRKKIAAGENSMTAFLKEVELNTQDDTSLPFLSIYFSDLQHGLAVGSFGMIVGTEDGGKHWAPWLDRIDNKGFLNLNVIRKVGDDLIIGGEQGGVYRYDEERGSFISVSAPYKGSFFDIVGTRSYMLAVGLRGTSYRSEDRGATWRHVNIPTTDSVTAGTVLDDGNTAVLTTEGGALLVSTDAGLTFTVGKALNPMMFTTVRALGTGRVVLAGLQGINVEPLSASRARVSHEVSK